MIVAQPLFPIRQSLADGATIQKAENPCIDSSQVRTADVGFKRFRILTLPLFRLFCGSGVYFPPRPPESIRIKSECCSIITGKKMTHLRQYGARVHHNIFISKSTNQVIPT